MYPGYYGYDIACVPSRYYLLPSPIPGAIAGIVLAIVAFVVTAIAIAVIVAIVMFKLRTGKWFKLRHKDDEKLTVDFKTDLLDLEGEEEKQTGMSSLKRILSWGKANVSDYITRVLYDFLLFMIRCMALLHVTSAVDIVHPKLKFRGLKSLHAVTSLHGIMVQY